MLKNFRLYLKYNIIEDLYGQKSESKFDALERHLLDSHKFTGFF